MRTEYRMRDMVFYDDDGNEIPDEELPWSSDAKEPDPCDDSQDWVYQDDGDAKSIEEAISKLEVKEAEATEGDKKDNIDKEETKGNEVTKTGDDTNVMIYVVAFVLAISLGIILFVRRKKE